MTIIMTCSGGRGEGSLGRTGQSHKGIKALLYIVTVVQYVFQETVLCGYSCIVCVSGERSVIIAAVV